MATFKNCEIFLTFVLMVLVVDIVCSRIASRLGKPGKNFKICLKFSENSFVVSPDFKYSFKLVQIVVTLNELLISVIWTDITLQMLATKRQKSC